VERRFEQELLLARQVTHTLPCRRCPADERSDSEDQLADLEGRGRVVEQRVRANSHVQPRRVWIYLERRVGHRVV
jgi:hypothetical protein